MFKRVLTDVWAFDAEWVPDPAAGRRLCNLPEGASDREAMQALWAAGGATPEDPRPYLKTALCRLVSISAVRRRVREGEISLELLSLPRFGGEALSEREILQRFFDGLGKHHPQLVGYNSGGADLRILIQRGVINGVCAQGFCRRPDKPWEGIDYFARDTDYHVDLMSVLAPWGRSPSLHEMATLSGIPGKMDVDGDQVAELWLDGQIDRIVAYNECDALTTYLLWLRIAHFGGHLTDDDYALEQDRARALLNALAPERPHIVQFLQLWTSYTPPP